MFEGAILWKIILRIKDRSNKFCTIGGNTYYFCPEEFLLWCKIRERNYLEQETY